MRNSSTLHVVKEPVESKVEMQAIQTSSTLQGINLCPFFGDFLHEVLAEHTAWLS